MEGPLLSQTGKKGRREGGKDGGKERREGGREREREKKERERGLGKGEAPAESNTGRALGGLQLKRPENERLRSPKATLVGGGQEEACEKSDRS